MTETNQKDNLISDKMSDKIIETAGMLVATEGAANMTVRRILQEMKITNRVFYNRFHNIDDVLEIVYKNTILKIRESIKKFDPEKDFFEQAADIVADSLVMSYDNKMRFNQYIFQNDSISKENYQWWMEEIKKLLSFAMEHDLIRKIDLDVVSYAVWCFCRGYNADAVGRGLPKEKAVADFRYSFKIFLDGLKVK